MKDPLGVSPSKGNQGTTRGEEKIHLTSVGIETVDLIRRSWVRFPPRSNEFFLYLVWFPDSLFECSPDIPSNLLILTVN